MPTYRVLILDAQGERESERVLDGRNDDDAIDQTGRIDHALGMEVWAGDRLVARFPPLGRASFDLGRT
jgi:hypothetical protein